jgi:hypothetical protein
VVSKNVKNFTAQNAVRKMFFFKNFCTENANGAATIRHLEVLMLRGDKQT